MERVAHTCIQRKRIAYLTMCPNGGGHILYWKAETSARLSACFSGAHGARRGSQ
jgi:hypothetical protein